ncbi:hypothetical protein, partial [Burkholderia vietnamiensis]|uniref:hypothetical protein n=1 Tax=Burkholderia vietnamiensis TaxID=60552 RepID=UPI001ABB6AC7
MKPSLRTLRHERSALRNSPFDSNGDVATRRILSVHFRAGSASAGSWLGPAWSQCTLKCVRETLINGPTSEVAGEMASNFLDDEANRRSIQ